jgi:hypothetical protein
LADFPLVMAGRRPGHPRLWLAKLAKWITGQSR